MIRINQIKMPIPHTAEQLEQKIMKLLHLSSSQLKEVKIVKKSLDARKKPQLFWVYTVDICSDKADEQVVQKIKNPNISVVKPKSYVFPQTGNERLKHSPVVIGAGPAGLFCAYVLSLMGYEPIVIERGKKVDERKIDVENFWKTGLLDPSSNVQFGEGGAGTFSDGKLNTAVKDSACRNSFVLETFVRFGAPDHILYDSKPHIGTDILSEVISNMREYLIEKGCRFYFNTCVTDFEIENNCIKKVICTNNLCFDTQVCILAIGHSARDTFEVLQKHLIPMECKQFAVGFRVEHPQQMINEKMYGKDYPNELMASAYKVTSNFPNGRGVYSFCMCPGGYVVNSSSGPNQTVVNGMSYSKRAGANANSAIIVSVGPKDFGAEDALAGMRYQIALEKKAYEIGQGKIPQQLYHDFVQNRASHCYGNYESTTKGDIVFANLRGLLNSEMEESFIAGMKHFDKIIPGFERPDAILSGVESRTSSPVRITRNEVFESEISGLYPCGEGAGYAGGIMSAAMDGIKVAEAVIKKYCLKASNR